MKRYILDASVAAKWFLTAPGEAFTAEALALLRLYTAGQAQFLVPDLFFAEFGNIFRRAERRGRCSSAVARAAVKRVLHLDLPAVPTKSLLLEATLLARCLDRSVYDCVYLALAMESGMDLVTADEKLANTLKKSYPVLCLGDL